MTGCVAINEAVAEKYVLSRQSLRMWIKEKSEQAAAGEEDDHREVDVMDV